MPEGGWRIFVWIFILYLQVKFAYSRSLAGVMFWTLDQDDFIGHYCNAGEYPLLNAIYNSIIELAPKQSQLIDDVSSSTTQSTTPIDFGRHNQTNNNKSNYSYKKIVIWQAMPNLVAFCCSILQFLLSWPNLCTCSTANVPFLSKQTLEYMNAYMVTLSFIVSKPIHL